MTDRIVLAGMVFNGRHGVLAEEQRDPQPFEVDVELLLDLRPAGEGDDLAATVDYRVVFETCRQVVEEERFQLLEALAEAIARRLLARLTLPADEIVVRVRKPRVPLPGRLAYAAVEIRRDGRAPST